jgi:hypothetical protein
MLKGVYKSFTRNIEVRNQIFKIFTFCMNNSMVATFRHTKDIFLEYLISEFDI